MTAKPALRTCAAVCGRPLTTWHVGADDRLWHPACLPDGTLLQKVLSPAAAARRIAQLEAELARLQAADPHHYLSTGCLHGDHAYCRSDTGAAGTKTPAVCKFCAAPCVCVCHQGQQ
ncbi:hypothetical protein OG689_10695 [Kitasatospora sp. NBC_00240]|uniref:hypothetical protein n=1 Tax=Kitasatospora sp. NBC_00240 TaxID=2903567 RepID=UPI002253EC2F|nr:hypothetical protein [Kitasatospora sp. NBC_00240]MCX5209751.1 hypothetical protein [Kitasatospora sp. NBC_00240]